MLCQVMLVWGQVICWKWYGGWDQKEKSQRFLKKDEKEDKRKGGEREREREREI